MASQLDEALCSRNDEDEEWSIDTSSEAVKARTEAIEKGLGEGFNKLSVDDITALPENERLQSFHSWLVANKDKTSKEIAGEVERLLVHDRGLGMLVELKFVNPEKLMDDLKNYRNLFVAILIKAKTKKYFLRAIEHFIIENEKVLLSKSAHIFQALYQLDYLEDEEILEWSKGTQREYSH